RRTTVHRQTCIVGEGLTRPECELQPRFEVEERDRSVLELRPDDALRGKAQCITIERHGSFEVIHSECQQRHTRLHGSRNFRGSSATARTDRTVAVVPSRETALSSPTTPDHARTSEE